MQTKVINGVTYGFVEVLKDAKDFIIYEEEQKGWWSYKIKVVTYDFFEEALHNGTWQIIGIAAELKCEGDDMFLCRHVIQEYASSLETTLILRKQK